MSYPTNTVVNVHHYGAAGDGTTDDTAAINAAMSEAVSSGVHVVWLGARTYAIANTINVPQDVTLRGVGAQSILKVSQSNNFAVALNGAQPALENLTVDAAGLVPSGAVRFSPDAVEPRIIDCHITNSKGDISGIGLDFRDRVLNARIEGCHFSGLATCIRVGRDPVGIRILNNRFTEWSNRGIQVLGTTDMAPRDIWIEGNYILPHSKKATHADVRQPIQFNGYDEKPFTNVHVNRNTVLGSGTSHADDTWPGSADLISLHRCNGFEVIGNMAVDGGDVGITVAQQCQNGIVADNVCLRNDSVGISNGSGTTAYVRNFTITGNVCMGNGLNRKADGPGWASAGISNRYASGFMIANNRCGDDKDTKTQNYGMLVQDSDQITLGINNFSGNVIDVLYEANNREPISGPSSSEQSLSLASVMPADKVVNNSTTLVDSGMSIPVEPNSAYRLEGLLRYNSSTNADMSLKFEGPSGASLTWSPGGLGQTVGSSTGSIVTTAAAISTTLVVGGAGGNGNIDATPFGLLTTGASGGALTLSFAQGTAEASNTTLRGGTSFLILTKVKTG